MDLYRQAADRLVQSRYAVALTGAGISVASGIPDFRGPSGLWSRYDPMEFGHIESFRADPAKVWGMLRELDDLLAQAKPNPAHNALAELEELQIVKQVITQNIDGLHQKAGSKNVVEFHGHVRTLRCDHCLKEYARETVALETLPPRCPCGDPLRPEVVFFGEAIPPEAYREAVKAASLADLMLVVGTSATVAPASHLPLLAKRSGAFIIEINPADTELSGSVSDLHLMEAASVALSGVLALLVNRNRS